MAFEAFYAPPHLVWKESVEEHCYHMTHPPERNLQEKVMEHNSCVNVDVDIVYNISMK